MFDYFNKYKKKIIIFTKTYLQQKQKELIKVNPWGRDICQRLLDFTTRGKMIRGCLVFLGATLNSNTLSKDMIFCASAMELLQSALLIHDDIMDNDYTRRGKPTIFAQYQEFGKKQKLNNYKNFGSAMGICLGDISFFSAYEILSKLTTAKITKEKIINLVSREMEYVGLAQMQDIYFGNSNKIPKEKDILKLYLYKTGRYTFSLPLMIGAILSNESPKNIYLLEKIGELIGVVFQLTDDKLNIFGNIKITGKPAGSDIREKKKTIFYINLIKNKFKLPKNILNKKTLSPNEIKVIQDHLVNFGITKKIEKIIARLKKQTEKYINRLDSSNHNNKKILKILLNYTVDREN